MTEIDSDDGNPELDKLLAELDKDGVSEESNNSKKDRSSLLTLQNKKDLNYEDPIDDETERTEDNTW